MFKVGDKVRVKNKLFFIQHPEYREEDNMVGCLATFINEMFEFCGKEFFIKEIKDNKYSGYYEDLDYVLKKNHLNDNIEDYWFNEYMFEKANKQLDLFED